MATKKSKEVYQVILSQDAASFFESSDAKLQKRLDRAFAQLALSPYQHPNIKALKGQLSGYYRYRIGNYRIVYRIEEIAGYYDCASESNLQRLARIR